MARSSSNESIDELSVGMPSAAAKAAGMRGTRGTGVIRGMACDAVSTTFESLPSTYLSRPHALPPLLLFFTLLSLLFAELIRDLAKGHQQCALVFRAVRAVDIGLFASLDLDGVGQI